MLPSLSRRSWRAAILALVVGALAFTGFVFAGGALAAPAGHFIPVSQCNDICFDAARNMLYMTSGGEILRYDLGSQSFEDPIDIGGSLTGIDLSPDGSTLAVADADYSGDAVDLPTGPDDFNWIYLVDPDTGDYQEVDFQRDFREIGTWMVAFDANGRVLVTSQFDGAGYTWLRRYDPETDETTNLRYVSQNSALSPSGDRSTIGVAETIMSNGQWDVYHASDGSIQTGASTYHYHYDIGVNHDGTQFALPSQAMDVFGPSLALSSTFGSPVGVHYSPTKDILYAPVAGTSIINAYDSNTLAVLHSYDCGQNFPTYDSNWTWASGFNWPRMTVGAGDDVVACTVGGGVEYFDSRANVHGHAKSSNGGGPVPGATAQIYRQHSGTWVLDDTVHANDSGDWSLETTDPSPVRVRVVDPSGGHGARWWGGTSVADATSAEPTDAPSPGADVTLPFVRGAVLGGYVSEETYGFALGSIRVTAASSDSSAAPVQTTTDADGVFHFTDLPPGHYVVRFDDPSLVWHRQFSGGADTTDTSDPVVVTGPGTYLTGAVLHRHVSALELSPAQPSAGSTLTAEVGGSATIQTTCTDANLDDMPRSGMSVVLQSSPDGSVWTTESVAVGQPSAGVYRATVASNAIVSKYFRFTAPDGAYIEGSSSDACLVRFVGPTSWNGPLQVVAPGSWVTTAPGTTAGVKCQLLRFDSTPAVGRRVVLQASVDNGAHWWTSQVLVTEGANAFYSAVFNPVQTLSYRLATVGTAAEPTVVSASNYVFVGGTPYELDNAWSDWGGGRIYSSNSSADYGTASHVDGFSSKYVSSAPAVRMYSSADGVNYTASPTLATYAGTIVHNGAVSAHWTAAIPRVYDLRYYVLVMQAQNGTGPVSPQVTGVSYINPTPLFTLGAPKTARAGRSITVSGVIKPHLTNGARVFGLNVRRVGSSSVKIYRGFPVHDKAGFSAFSVKLKLPKSGKYVISGFVDTRVPWPLGPWGQAPLWGGSQHPMARTVVVR